MEESSGEKKKWQALTGQISKHLKINLREWDADTPMEPATADNLPRTLGQVPPKPLYDDHVNILEFVEEEDKHSQSGERRRSPSTRNRNPDNRQKRKDKRKHGGRKVKAVLNKSTLPR